MDNQSSVNNDKIKFYPKKMKQYKIINENQEEKFLKKLIPKKGKIIFPKRKFKMNAINIINKRYYTDREKLSVRRQKNLAKLKRVCFYFQNYTLNQKKRKNAAQEVFQLHIFLLVSHIYLNISIYDSRSSATSWFEVELFAVFRTGSTPDMPSL